MMFVSFRHFFSDILMPDFIDYIRQIFQTVDRKIFPQRSLGRQAAGDEKGNENNSYFKPHHRASLKAVVEGGLKNR